jgi:putative PIN family toxin of toxin-antitoxin system
VAELRSTLSYNRLAKYVERSGLTLDELLTRHLNVAIVVEPDTVPQIVRDPDDDHVLARALNASADLIVSGDQDLLVLGSYQDVPIVTAAEALRRIEAQK